MKRKPWLRRLYRLFLQHRSTLGLLSLIVASYAGNLTRWTLFFNIDFIFGSIAVWLVVGLYGVRWGTLAGLIGGICTYFLWNHPYAALIFTCEAFVVGWLFHRYRQNLVLLTGMFWIAIGIPLAWLFYAVILQVDPGQAQIILLKQPVNGIFNALIASLLMTHLPIHRWLGRPQAVNTLSFRQTLFNLLVAFVFLPTLLLIVLASRDVVDNIKTAAQANLSRASSHTISETRSWYEEHLRSMNEVVRQLSDPNLDEFSRLQQHLESTQQQLPDFASLTVFDADQTTILASTSRGKPIAPQANQPYLQLAKMTWQPVFSDVLPDSVPPTIVWTIPVIQEGKLRGVIVSEIILDRINELLKQNANKQQVQLTLVGRRHQVIASTQVDRLPNQLFDRRQDGTLDWLDPQTYQWLPSKGSQLIMVRWMNSFFVQEAPVVAGLPWTLVVESSATPDVLYIQSVYSRNLVIILAIAVLALIFSALISRRLVRPLAQLATVTTNLPDKLLAGRPIEWIDSPVTEIAFLVQNFRTMSATLTEQFQEIQQVLDYEALLKRITDKVRDSLDESQILQAAVQELGQGTQVICCDAALYNAEQTTSTIRYEYTTSLPSAQGEVFSVPGEFSEVHSRLLRGEHCQFCFIPPHLFRPLTQQVTILACPIVDDQSVLGELWLFKPRNTIFDELEIRLVQQVANQCAIALRQAQLYQTAQVQVQALEKLNYLKDDFLSTVSHELRTPITNIKMAIKMLKLTTAETQRERYFKILQMECDREADLINDLLDLQRLASGTKALNLEPIHLQEWVTHIVESFQERTYNRQQILQVEISSELPIITSDSACLERILTELLNNACKYTPPGEQIRVTARTVDNITGNLADNITGNAINNAATRDTPSLADLSLIYTSLFVLDVCNSGVEIPPSELDHIFEKFYRVPGSDRWKQGGTGLGLALVQKMAEHLGGSIQVKSAAKQTCFTVKLPVAPVVV
jgi:signal transduction histidine kinase/HAMP domain-containing protein